MTTLLGPGGPSGEPLPLGEPHRESPRRHRTVRPDERGRGSPRPGSWRVPSVVLVCLLVATSTGLLSERAAATAASPPRASPSGSASLPIVPSATTARLLQHHFQDVVLTPAVRGLYANLYGSAWFAYAPWDTSYYVAVDTSTYQRGSVAVVQASNTTVTATIPVGFSPFGVAVDPRTQEVFVTNSGSDNVTVINGTTQMVIGSINVGARPMGIAYDASNGTLYVADNGSGSVTVILASTWTVVANVSVGSGPLGVAWDEATDQVFVADWGSNEVSVIEAGSHNGIGATIPVGLRPFGLAVDNATDDVYVTNEGSSNLSVLSATSLTVNATITVVGTVGLQGVAYDSQRDLIWVAGGYDYAVIVNASTESVEDYIQVDPMGVVYNPDNGNICFTNDVNATFTCFVLGDYGGTPPVTVTFSESGLPSGTPWNVTLGPDYYPNTRENATLASSTTSLVFEVPCTWGWAGYNQSFYVGSPLGYVASPAQGFVASTSCTNLTVTVGIAFYPSPGPFPVSFAETGLASGTNWSVTLNGTPGWTTGGRIVFYEPNGTYPYSVGSVSGYTVPSNGNVTVAGLPVRLVIAFVAIAPPTYAVAFNQTGLAGGGNANWSVTLGGTTHFRDWDGTGVSFREPNGTYAYTVGAISGYTSSPSGGNVTVHGLPVDIWVTFTANSSTALAFGVGFNETGLPNGTNWSVMLSGTLHTSNSTRISFLEPNGTYAYTVGAVYRYDASPASGTVTVYGANVTQPIAFTANTSGGSGSGLRIVSFTVDPEELPIGTATSVSVVTSGGIGTLTFAYSGFPNGCTPPDRSTWSCTPTVAGHSDLEVRVTDSSGASANASTALTVSAAGGGGGAPPFLSGSEGYAIGIGLVALLVAALAAAVWSRRGRREAPESPPSESPYRVSDLPYGASRARAIGLPSVEGGPDPL
ncbi:MAG TPA: YncE family protein, partial [Thermoplasmata archaeon]|nr:YncE family protein [Thermoplasmata archaeon]